MLSLLFYYNLIPLLVLSPKVLCRAISHSWKQWFNIFTMMTCWCKTSVMSNLIRARCHVCSVVAAQLCRKLMSPFFPPLPTPLWLFNCSCNQSELMTQYQTCLTWWTNLRCGWWFRGMEPATNGPILLFILFSKRRLSKHTHITEVPQERRTDAQPWQKNLERK